MLQGCDRNHNLDADQSPTTIAGLISQTGVNLDTLRQLHQRQLILLRSPQQDPQT